MNFKESDTQRFLKTPDKAVRCVLLFGSNEGMIADLSQKFMQTACEDLNDAFRVSTIEMETLEKDIGVLFAEYNAVSFLGGRRVVLIKDVNNNLTKPLKELMENTSSDTLLVMTSSSLNTKSSLVTYLKDSSFGVIVGCYDDRIENINAYVRDFFIKQQITIAVDAMDLLCQRLSVDRKSSMNELEKLTTYIGSKRNVTLEDVRKAVSDTSGSSLEDLCYFVALGETQKALTAYQTLINEGQEAVQILRALAYHFMKILDCVSKIESGATPDSASLSVKPPLMWFRKSDFILQLKTWKRKSVLDVLTLLYKAERDCKTTDYPADEIGSWSLMQISGAARKLKNVYNG